MPLWEGQRICDKVGQSEDNPRATGIFILIPNCNSDFSLKLFAFCCCSMHSNTDCNAFMLIQDDNMGGCWHQLCWREGDVISRSIRAMQIFPGPVHCSLIFFLYDVYVLFTFTQLFRQNKCSCLGLEPIISSSMAIQEVVPCMGDPGEIPPASGWSSGFRMSGCGLSSALLLNVKYFQSPWEHIKMIFQPHWSVLAQRAEQGHFI